MKIQERFAAHPADFVQYGTERIRRDFLIETLFEANEINLVYSQYDRFITGGVLPLKKLVLETFESLKSSFFLERREMGIINIGDKGIVTADNIPYELNHKDAMYLGMGTKEVSFESANPKAPARFYLNSAPAHRNYPSALIKFNHAEKAETGTPETSNHRKINKLIINSLVPTCQLQMGLTELQTGSVWNTMPAHTHNRRMEVYFYFNIPEGQAVCHFMGQPDETRHIWVSNEQAVISPSWSIHSGVGTANYSFIWGMAGENLDYSDMDSCTADKLR